MDQRGLHRETLLDVDALVREIRPADLSQPTPCAGWTLADLLAHMVGQHAGFAAAVRDGDAPASSYAPVPFTQGAWADSVTSLLDSFADADLDAEVVEIEFSTRPLPVRVLVGAQLLDAAVHGWDVARTLGRDFRPSDAVVEAVVAIGTPIADDERRAAAGFFGPALDRQGSEWDSILAHLGRDPEWGRGDVG